DQRHGHCQTIAGLWLPCADRVLSPRRSRGNHDRADGDRKQRDPRCLCRGAPPYPRRRSGISAQGSAHAGYQPAGRGAGSQGTDVTLEEGLRPSWSSKELAMSVQFSRPAYAGHYGPTTGDRIRLADTELIIEIEKDHTVYGEEVQFGGGKVIRDSQGQSPLPEIKKQKFGPPLDLVITNAVVLEHWGIVKGDIGIRDGRIVGIGKAGNPLIQPGVDPKLVIGPGTEVIAGENLIATAGGIDSHVHFICPQLVETAIAAGLTTLIGGGTGPATGTNATTCTSGAWNMQRMLQA